ncbi:uncharacterized protein LOC126263251 [Schistocerca nitens]|uniref:uncharacterized protein LOC126263251 n=1 Tax=Schistocerca nitens TaxID=7011 RepID=UPI0021173111|nr:uncharacterized protein LOC126263251 [Schistocerca nitens]
MQLRSKQNENINNLRSEMRAEIDEMLGENLNKQLNAIKTELTEVKNTLEGNLRVVESRVDNVEKKVIVFENEFIAENSNRAREIQELQNENESLVEKFNDLKVNSVNVVSSVEKTVDSLESNLTNKLDTLKTKINQVEEYVVNKLLYSHGPAWSNLLVKNRGRRRNVTYYYNKTSGRQNKYTPQITDTHVQHQINTLNFDQKFWKTIRENNHVESNKVLLRISQMRLLQLCQNFIIGSDLNKLFNENEKLCEEREMELNVTVGRMHDGKSFDFDENMEANDVVGSCTEVSNGEINAVCECQVFVEIISSEVVKLCDNEVYICEHYDEVSVVNDEVSVVSNEEKDTNASEGQWQSVKCNEYLLYAQPVVSIDDNESVNVCLKLLKTDQENNEVCFLSCDMETIYGTEAYSMTCAIVVVVYSCYACVFAHLTPGINRAREIQELQNENESLVEKFNDLKVNSVNAVSSVEKTVDSLESNLTNKLDTLKTKINQVEEYVVNKLLYSHGSAWSNLALERGNMQNFNNRELQQGGGGDSNRYGDKREYRDNRHGQHRGNNRNHNDRGRRRNVTYYYNKTSGRQNKYTPQITDTHVQHQINTLNFDQKFWKTIRENNHVESNKVLLRISQMRLLQLCQNFIIGSDLNKLFNENEKLCEEREMELNVTVGRMHDGKSFDFDENMEANDVVGSCTEVSNGEINAVCECQVFVEIISSEVVKLCDNEVYICEHYDEVSVVNDEVSVVSNEEKDTNASEGQWQSVKCNEYLLYAQPVVSIDDNESVNVCLKLLKTDQENNEVCFLSCDMETIYGTEAYSMTCAIVVVVYSCYACLFAHLTPGINRAREIQELQNENESLVEKFNDLKVNSVNAVSSVEKTVDSLESNLTNKLDTLITKINQVEEYVVNKLLYSHGSAWSNLLVKNRGRRRNVTYYYNKTSGRQNKYTPQITDTHVQHQINTLNFDQKFWKTIRENNHVESNKVLLRISQMRLLQLCQNFIIGSDLNKLFNENEKLCEEREMELNVTVGRMHDEESFDFDENMEANDVVGSCTEVSNGEINAVCECQVFVEIISSEVVKLCDNEVYICEHYDEVSVVNDEVSVVSNEEKDTNASEEQWQSVKCNEYLLYAQPVVSIDDNESVNVCLKLLKTDQENNEVCFLSCDMETIYGTEAYSMTCAIVVVVYSCYACLFAHLTPGINRAREIQELQNENESLVEKFNDLKVNSVNEVSSVEKTVDSLESNLTNKLDTLKTKINQVEEYVVNKLLYSHGSAWSNLGRRRNVTYYYNKTSGRQNKYTPQITDTHVQHQINTLNFDQKFWKTIRENNHVESNKVLLRISQMRLLQLCQNFIIGSDLNKLFNENEKLCEEREMELNVTVGRMHDEESFDFDENMEANDVVGSCTEVSNGEINAVCECQVFVEIISSEVVKLCDNEVYICEHYDEVSVVNDEVSVVSNEEKDTNASEGQWQSVKCNEYLLYAQPVVSIDDNESVNVCLKLLKTDQENNEVCFLSCDMETIYGTEAYSMTCAIVVVVYSCYACVFAHLTPGINRAREIQELQNENESLVEKFNDLKVNSVNAVSSVEKTVDSLESNLTNKLDTLKTKINQVEEYVVNKLLYSHGSAWSNLLVKNRGRRRNVTYYYNKTSGRQNKYTPQITDTHVQHQINTLNFDQKFWKTIRENNHVESNKVLLRISQMRLLQLCQNFIIGSDLNKLFNENEKLCEEREMELNVTVGRMHDGKSFDFDENMEANDVVGSCTEVSNGEINAVCECQVFVEIISSEVVKLCDNEVYICEHYDEVSVVNDEVSVVSNEEKDTNASEGQWQSVKCNEYLLYAQPVVSIDDNESVNVCLKLLKTDQENNEVCFLSCDMETIYGTEAYSICSLLMLVIRHFGEHFDIHILCLLLFSSCADVIYAENILLLLLLYFLSLYIGKD